MMTVALMKTQCRSWAIALATGRASRRKVLCLFQFYFHYSQNAWQKKYTLYLINVLKAPFNKVAETPTQVFSREYYEIFKNSFSNTTALVAPANSFTKTICCSIRRPFSRALKDNR